MSVLHRRLMSGNATTAVLPYGTSATPMVMPLATVEYDGLTVRYNDLEPLNTGDVNAAPVAASAPGRWGQVVAAGRP